MAGLIINQDRLTKELAEELAAICPFGALKETAGRLEVGESCRMCRLCIKHGKGIISEEKTAPVINKKEWRGIAVFADFSHRRLHPISLELLGKARELAEITKEPVYALLMGNEIGHAAKRLLAGGADKVYVYESPVLEEFSIEPFADAFEDFIKKVKPSAVLVGATNMGRSLAPRVAARLKTGLTADCTALEMRENTDLVQIRPAFGGNIMAQIITPNHRPQFCTVRYKIFSQWDGKNSGQGEIVPCTMPKKTGEYGIQINHVEEMPKDVDIAEADILVAVGRGVKSRTDMELACRLAKLIGAQMACTRPLVESGQFTQKSQIGLSGRTVKPKLLITLGVSGAIQFAAGIQGAECIVAVNSDSTAPIFQRAHYCLKGDVSKVLPKIVRRIEEAIYVS